MQVDSPRLVAGVEDQLLIAGQARHAHAAQNPEVERLCRIVKLPSAEVGLAAVPGCIENHRVNVDPASALSDQLDTNWPPVSFHAVAPTLQKAYRHRLVAGIQRQVEVTVLPRLPTNQSVDTPTASDPNRAAGLPQIRHDSHHLTEIHTLACSVGRHNTLGP